MTQEQMKQFIVYDNPITRNSVRVDFINGTHEIGFFIDYDEFNGDNKWRFIPNRLSVNYRETKSLEYSITIDGNNVTKLTLL